MNTKDNLAKAFIYTLLMALVYVLSIYLPRMHYALALIIGAALFVTIILNPLVGLIAIALTSEYTNIEKAISLPAGLSTDLFLGLAVFSGFILEKVRRRSTTLQKSPYDMPMAYIILFLSIGILAGSNSGYNQFTDNLQILSFLKIISLVSIYYITYNILDSKRKIRIVFNSILIGTAAVGGISILLYMMNIQNPIPNIEVFTGDPSGLKRLQGFSEDPNNFATFFAYLIPYPIIMLLYKKKRVEKIYYNLLAVIFLTSTILTFSRSEWIAALTSLVVAYILICK
ncbi:MAG: hypothetical protein KKD39_03970, partial [Candidatus Altiarchaeota archaeon]|nr:hypothetical protein [Candidatus Altiarchaeota archaeon]